MRFRLVPNSVTLDDLRKSHMRFRLVPNSVTLDDLERRNSSNGRLILPNSVAFGADYVKVV